MPPEYNDLPEPKTENGENTSDSNKIKELVSNNIEEEKTEETNQNFEKSLLEKIKKN